MRRVIPGIIASIAVVGLLFSVSARADVLNLGDFESGMDGWQVSTDVAASDYLVDVENVAGRGNMLHMHWDKVNGALQGSHLSVYKTWDASKQGVTADNLNISFASEGDAQPWTVFFVAKFASENSAIAHETNAYWPGTHTDISFGSGNFGVDQATFATMDYLEVKIASNALSYEAAGLPHVSLAIDNIALSPVTVQEAAPVPEPSSLAAFAMLGVAGLGMIRKRR